MPTPGGEPRMRRNYQVLAPSGIGAPRLGTDGNWIVYPVRGIVQGLRHSQPSPARRRTVIYVAALSFAATISAAALILAGYRLTAPLTVLVLGVAAAVAERSNVRVTKAT